MPQVKNNLISPLIDKIKSYVEKEIEKQMAYSQTVESVKKSNIYGYRQTLLDLSAPRNNADTFTFGGNGKNFNASE
jgi:hypothetical protein